ncbi:MAG: efflux RND transporter permease subunit [Planctomycetia bacterium]|nr:efflux RND transporter permease subunit [Planctomycetia bacterium]
MNIAAFAIRNRKVTYVLSAIVFLTGIYAYNELGRLEMPDFVIKTAVVTTPYPGASPVEVEQEVTQVIEESLQALGEIKELYSLSQEGLSIVYVEMEDQKTSDELPQVWDELRRKVNDNQSKLPPGAGPSTVNDDFGDVYGLFYALSLKEPASSDPSGFDPTLRELRLFARELKKELLLCQDVKKIEYWGVRQEVVYMEIRHSRMAELGIPMESILGLLQSQNLVESSGKVKISDQYIRITPDGDFTSVSDIGELLITGQNGSTIRLGDIAEIKRGYVEPPSQIMTLNGKPAIGFGISTVAGGNAVEMEKSVRQRMEYLQESGFFPANVELSTISNQGQTVTQSLQAFMVNLVESVLIVIALLMIFMGWQSGLLIGAILLLTIYSTFIYMWCCGITMQLISLGSLILALGMLVDNAIVIAEGIIIGVQRGKSREEAAIETVSQTQWPLLGATVIAVLAFAAIGFAPGNVGEFCRSLFWVMMSSLLLSWVFAVTTTPLLCVDFLKIPPMKGDNPYNHPLFQGYWKFLERVLQFRFLSVGIVAGLLIFSCWAFGMFVSDSFFADSDRNQFYVDYWRPQGTYIEETSQDLDQLEEYIWNLGKKIDAEGIQPPGWGTRFSNFMNWLVNGSAENTSEDDRAVQQIARFVGSGTLRFILAYDAKDLNSAFGQLIVTVRNKAMVERLKPMIEEYARKRFPDAETQVVRFANGPSNAYKIECRLRGPDRGKLRQLSAQAQQIMAEEGAWNIREDWRQPVEVKRPIIQETQTRLHGVTRSDIAKALQTNFGGMTVGVYREKEDLLPILVRPEKDLRNSYGNINNIQVTTASGAMIPLSQLISQVDRGVMEDSLIRRRHQQKTITAQCNPPGDELPSETLARIMPRIQDEIERHLPAGYSIEWGGEYKSSNDGKEPLARMFPICLGAMFLILICQFNQFRPPIIIFSCVPLALIGVTWGLIFSNLPFSFMAILGLLGLSGMLIKNGIILIEQVQFNRDVAGMRPYEAVVDAAVSRMRPVCMAAGTTVLGMLPLMWDPFYNSMGATVAGGLIGATALTLLVVPLFYVILYRCYPE